MESALADFLRYVPVCPTLICLDTLEFTVRTRHRCPSSFRSSRTATPDRGAPGWRTRGSCASEVVVALPPKRDSPPVCRPFMKGTAVHGRRD
jgi:hypothetical protein